MRSFAEREILLANSNLEITVAQRLESESWDSFFDLDQKQPGSQKLVVEIGVGRDTHLIRRAQDYPNELHLAFEYSRKKLLGFLSKAYDSALPNIRGMQADAKRVLPAFFEDATIDTAFVFFPDPWPKKRHHKKRIIQPEFIAQLAQKMKAQGQLELRTDDRNYAEHMLEVMESSPSFSNATGQSKWLDTPREEEGHRATLFEKRFMQQEKHLHYFYYVKN